MRLFVNEEKPFIVDPANRNVDEATQDRRKYGAGRALVGDRGVGQAEGQIERDHRGEVGIKEISCADQSGR